MTKEQLQDRINKKEQEITKIEKRISKWSKGLRPEDIAVCEPFGNCIYGTAPRSMDWRNYHGTPEYQEARKNYDEYIKLHKNDIPEGDDWNKGPNIGELYSAYRDLGEARNTLNKYKTELTNLNKFDSEDKIEVIWNFLQDWKNKSHSYYVGEVKRYKELKDNYTKAWEDYKNSVAYEDEVNNLSRYYKYNPSYEVERRFRRDYYEDIDSFTKEIYLPGGKVDEEKLEKALDKEMRDKYKRLVNEVTEKAGEIQDASGLKINARGEINGIIKGSKNSVKLWLTLAMGEVQRPHYRGYCNIVK